MLPNQILFQGNSEGNLNIHSFSNQQLINMILQQYQNSALLSLLSLLPIQNQYQDPIPIQIEMKENKQEEGTINQIIKDKTKGIETAKDSKQTDEIITKFKSELINSGSSSDEKKSKHKLLPSCIRKRLKTFLNNYIVNKINLMVSKMKSNFYVFNLPKQLIYNSKINSKDYLFNLKIKEIFSINQTGLVDKRVIHNTKVMKEIQELGNYEIVAFVNKELKQVYFEYLESEEFLASARNIRELEGEEYFNSFIEISKNLLVRSYY